MSKSSKNQYEGGDLKSPLLASGKNGAVLQNNVVMAQMRQRMSEAQNRMTQANQKKSLINLSALDPTKSLMKATEQSSKISQFFTPKNIFLIYGVLDIVIFIFMLQLIIRYKMGSLPISILAAYFINCGLFVAVLLNDTLNTRFYYQRWLRFKLIFFGFTLPLLALAISEATLESQICSQVLQKYGIDMTAEDMQKIIDKEEFSLLLQTKSGQHQQSPSNDQLSRLSLASLTSSASRIGQKLQRTTQDLSSMVTEGDPFTPLSKDEREMKYIQFCSTSVVLSSMVLIVIYQLLSGQQYFIARGRHIATLQREEYNKKFLDKLNNLSKYRMDKFTQGNPKFLLGELKEAYVTLDNQIYDSVKARKMTMMTDESAEADKEEGVKFAIN